MYLLTDTLLERIEDLVCRHEPERGGALLGPVGYPMATDFLLDTDAHTTRVVYVPSDRLTERVGEVERQGVLELKGVLHSHPGLDRLSGQDVASFAGLLDLNPHMPWCLAPVVTAGLAPAGPHELALPSGKVSLYRVVRRSAGSPRVEPIRADVVPVSAAVRHLARTLRPERTEVWGPTNSLGPATLDVSLTGTRIGDVLVAFPVGYPLAAPVVVVSHDGAARHVPLRWRLDRDPARQLADRLGGLPPAHPEPTLDDQLGLLLQALEAQP